jgi:hypothetical protein
MAVTDWDRLTSITRELVLPGIADSIVKDNPILFRLMDKGDRKSGGKRIEQVVRYANNTQGGAYEGLDTLDTASEDTRTRAYFSWRQYHQPIVFSNIDIAKNGGEGKIEDLLKTEMEDAKLALQDKFGTALFTAQSGKSLDSLVDACDDGTNVASYGGITRSTYTWFKGNYTASSGALSLTNMATMYDSCKSGSKVPTIIVTHESEWSSYEALLHPHVRFNFDAGNGFPKIDGGFQAMMFRGTPVVADEYCTDGYMYFLYEPTLKFVTLKHPKYPTDKRGFSLTQMREPTDQDGQVGFILWYGNLICTEPRKQGVLRGIT